MPRRRRSGFTLVEMLIVVALMAVLMTIVFKLSSVGKSETYRNTTIIRLAKLENCLSGYYAAYGSYPPVRCHNTRSILEGVNSYGVQNVEGSNARGSRALSESELWGWNVKTFQKDIREKGDRRLYEGDPSSQDDEKKAWAQVKAACESQPVAMESPDPEIDGLDFGETREFLMGNSMIDSDNPDYAKWSAGFGSFFDNQNSLSSLKDEISWRKVQIFKFGLMSFLLPRFQSMMGWPSQRMFDGEDDSCTYAQWNANNGMEPRDPMQGGVQSWKDINEQVRKAMGYGSSSGSETEMRGSSAYLEALPSEAVTARWMPNLAGCCVCDYSERSFFGIEINDPEYSDGLFAGSSGRVPPLKVYAPDGASPYRLNSVTVLDGWGSEFFYYSPSPHQSYQLWSAGRNKRTFPPWISRKNLDSNARERVAVWVEDDIRGMSN